MHDCNQLTDFNQTGITGCLPPYFELKRWVIKNKHGVSCTHYVQFIIYLQKLFFKCFHPVLNNTSMYIL